MHFNELFLDEIAELTSMLMESLSMTVASSPLLVEEAVYEGTDGDGEEDPRQGSGDCH